MNIYFSGIGGVGLGPLAEIARDAGHTVMGSDPNPSLTTEELAASGIIFSTNQDGNFLRQTHQNTPIDWYVYTAGLPDNHPELATARDLGLHITKRDKLLAHIISEKDLKLIAVSGTHGKTSTTGLLVWAFKQLGIPISYSIGTTISFGPSGAYDPKSKYFIYECDEFDRNFLAFHPYISLIMSIDHDHPDIYPTEAEYREAFTQFCSQSQHVISWQSVIANDISAPHDSWLLQDEEVLPIKLPGEHTRRNATLVAKCFEYLELADDSIFPILESFPGTDRRFEKIANYLYSDYGHHPVEIAATLQMAREICSQVILVYQPHQNIRQHEIKDQYTDCMELATAIYWVPTYLSRENPALEVLTPNQLIANLSNRDKVTVTNLNDELWNHIQIHIAQGHLVLCMGAGTIDAWVRERAKTLFR